MPGSAVVLLAVHRAPLSPLRGSGCAEKPLKIRSKLGSWGACPRSSPGWCHERAAAAPAELGPAPPLRVRGSVLGALSVPAAARSTSTSACPARAPSPAGRHKDGAELREFAASPEDGEMWQKRGLACCVRGHLNPYLLVAFEFSSGSSQTLVEIKGLGTRSVMVLWEQDAQAGRSVPEPRANPPRPESPRCGSCSGLPSTAALAPGLLGCGCRLVRVQPALGGRRGERSSLPGGVELASSGFPRAWADHTFLFLPFPTVPRSDGSQPRARAQLGSKPHSFS